VNVLKLLWAVALPCGKLQDSVATGPLLLHSVHGGIHSHEISNYDLSSMFIVNIFYLYITFFLSRLIILSLMSFFGFAIFSTVFPLV
jgi:hypothetical protein